MRSSICTDCHYARYGEAKNEKLRKDTPHAKACMAARLRKTEKQVPPTLSVFRDAVRGRLNI
jgi:hypothetical protein